MNLFKPLSGLALAACAILPSMAQTSSNPLEIVPGEENYYDAGQTYSTVYYTYTAPEDQLVYLNGMRVYSVKSDNVSQSCATWYTNPGTLFPAKAGQTYLLDGQTSNETYVRFTVELSAWNPEQGLSQTDPILGKTDGPTYLPTQQEDGGWYAPYIPVYVKLTSPLNGKLAIGTTQSPQHLYLVKESGNEELNPQYTSDGGLYRVTVPVTENEDVLLQFEKSSPMAGFFSFSEIIPGTSMEDAYEGVIGENIIPAAAGTYWYSITSPTDLSDCFMVITSDVEGTLTGYSATGYSSFNCDRIYTRQSTYSNTKQYLKITKGETATDGTFNIEFEPYQPYDKYSTALEITPGETIETPAFPGNYFYNVNPPAEGAWFADITAEGEGQEYSFYFYKKPSEYTTLAYGKTIHWELLKGESYILKVNVPENANGITFKYELNEVQPGQTAANPLQAVLGLNEVPESMGIYYDYTPEESGWLCIERNGLADPHLTSSDNKAVTTYPINENSIRWEVTAGVTYLMTFSNVPADASFTLSYEPYAEGESSANPLPAVQGENILPIPAGKTWYAYEVETSGFFLMNTNVAYNNNNELCAYVNDIDGRRYGMTSSGGWGDQYYTELTVPVTEGDVVYILVKTVLPREDEWINIQNIAPQPGQTAGSAVEIELPDEVNYIELPETTYGSEYWLTFTLEETKKLTITMSGYCTAYLLKSDATTQIANVGYNYTENSYVVKPTTLEAGKYYFRIDSTSEQTSTWTFLQPEPGETMENPIVIPVTGDPTLYDFENKPSSMSFIWYSIQLNAGDFQMSCPTNWMVGNLRDANGNNLASMADISGSYSDIYGFSGGPVQIPEAGTYYLYFTTLSVNNINQGHATFTGTALQGGVNVETIGEDAAVEAEYYTLDGRRVNGQPQAGIYIVHRGEKTSKIVIR